MNIAELKACKKACELEVKAILQDCFNKLAAAGVSVDYVGIDSEAPSWGASAMPRRVNWVKIHASLD